MVHIKEISVRSEKNSLFESFDHLHQVWVVSDLQSKFELQGQLLNRTNLINESAVSRASELWFRACEKVNPTIHWVSRELMISVLDDLIVNLPYDCAKSPGASKTLLSYLGHLLPLLVFDEQRDQLHEWFIEHPSSYIRWGHWYELCATVWQELRTKNWALKSWSAAILIECANECPEVLEGLFPDSLVFDLGMELTPLEADLIARISHAQKVTVLKPMPAWGDSYAAHLWPYKILKDEGFTDSDFKRSIDFDSLKTLTTSVNFKRFTTQVAEVKNAVDQIRKWADRGVRLDQMAILAPNIEPYWATLSVHLQQEGIYFDKSLVTRLQSFDGVANLLAQLRLAEGKVSGSDIESVLLPESNLSYEKFKRFFRNIYDESDLNRHNKVLELFTNQQVNVKSLSRDEYLTIVIGRYSDANTDPLEMLINTIYIDAPPYLKMSLGSWVRFTESLCAKIETEILPRSRHGVFCGNLNNGDSLNRPYSIILGALESELTANSQEGLAGHEAISLSQSLGVHLLTGERVTGEFQLLWYLDAPFQDVQVTVATARFDGQVEAPSKIWIMGALFAGRDVEQVESANVTRLCEKIIRGPQKPQVFTKVDADKGKSDRENLAITPSKVRLSVSQVEAYLSCPFIFKARKIFSLSDLPDLDLDLDHLTRGQVMHGLLEYLLAPPVRWDWSENQVKEVVLKVLEQSDMPEQKTFDGVVDRYVQLGLRFIDFEKQWRAEFPQTETMGLEVKVKGYWSLSEAQPSALKGDFPVLGFIDRVDHSKGSDGVCLIDYKSSAAQTKHYGSWVQNKMLQMALYSLFVEKGLAENIKGPVVAAQYYVPKILDRNKGFQLSEGVNWLPKASRFNGVTPESKLALFKEVSSVFQEVAQKISEGKMPTDPEQFKQCGTCHWNRICRASHLM